MWSVLPLAHGWNKCTGDWDLVTTMARAAKNPLDGSIWIRSFLSRYPFALSRQGAPVGELASFIQAWSENRRKKVIFGLQLWQLWQSVMFEGKSSSEGPRQRDERVDRSGQISPLHCLQRKSLHSLQFLQNSQSKEIGYTLFSLFLFFLGLPFSDSLSLLNFISFDSLLED